MNLPLVSIITVVYNGAKTLERTIRSVAEQSYSNIEYIIIDGGSKDGTIDIIKQHKSISKWISEPDKGIYDGMNKGVKMASGQLIGTLNSDDWLEPDAIKLIVDEYIKSSSDVISGAIQLWNGEVRDKIFLPDLKGLTKKMTIYHPGTYITKDAYLKHGLYSLEYRIASDYDLILKMYKCGASFSCINDVIANMASGGISDVNWVAGLKEIKNIRSQYTGWFASNFDFYKTYIKHNTIIFLYALGLKKTYLFYKRIKLKIFKDSVVLN